MAIINGTASNDILIGTVGDDTINGLGGDDLINGLGGSDRINGGAGNDAINPGTNTGSDRIISSTGNDTINFVDADADSFYILDYSAETAGLNVNIGNTTGTIAKSSGTDTLLNVDKINGTTLNGGLSFLGGSGNDTLTSDLIDTNEFIQFRPNGGNDTITGGSGFNRLDYFNAATAVTVNVTSSVNNGFDGTSVMSGTTVNDGFGGTDTFFTIFEIRGSRFDDIFNGSAGNDRFITQRGNDTVNGGGGFDLVRYDRNGVVDGITVDLNLTVGTVTGIFSGEAFSDNLTSVESINGSRNADDSITGSGADERLNGRGGNDTINGGGGNDLLLGEAGNDILTGGTGNDTVNGGAGVDTASYASATSAVTVNLTTQGTQQNTVGAGTDTLISIENLIGSSNNDTLIGDANANTLNGGAGDDTLDGGNGTDTADFRQENADLTINLLAGTATGAGNDTLISIERVIGSFNGKNTIIGGAGNNFLQGGGNDDIIIFGTNTDFDQYFSNGGNDTIDFVNADADSFYLINYFLETADLNINIGGTTGTVVKGSGTDTFLNVDAIVGNNNSGIGINGGSGNDTFTANLLDASRFIQFFGRGGNDTFTGGGGFDRIQYSNAAAGIVVNVTSSSATGFNVAGVMSGTTTDDGDGGTDTFFQIDEVRGSRFDDTFNGSAGNDRFITDQGNDTVNGGGGFDLVLYNRSGIDAITVDLNLTTGTVTGNFFGVAFSDNLTSVESIRGSRTGDDSITGSGVAEKLDGRGGNDTINGGGGNDLLLGDDGNDTLTGGTGNDSIIGGAGDDIINGNAGNDGMQGGDGNDIMDGGVGNDVLLAGAGNDMLIGGTGTNILNGGSGNDIFIGGAGADDFRGSTGFDTVDYSSVTIGAISINLITGLSIGFGANGDTFADIEKIIGTDRRDFLAGTDGANELDGGGGNDTITGRLGDDVVSGGIGNDSVFGGVGADIVNGGAGNDGMQGGDGNDIMDGGAGNDVLLAGAGNDMLIGGTGTNILNGGSGNDIFIGGAGADDFRGSTGFDTVDYSSVAIGAISINLITGLSIGFGANGDTFADIEKIIGTDRRDFLAGTDGANELDGGGGNDTITGRLGDDVVSGGIGNDSVFGGVGADIVNGGVGNDGMQGGDGNDIMDGGDGNDLLLAGAGNDTLIGGAGNDRMLGGTGTDSFVFKTNFGNDKIVDFNDGTEMVDVTGVTGASVGSLNVTLGISGNVFADFGGSDTIEFVNFTNVNAITVDDFLF